MLTFWDYSVVIFYLMFMMAIGFVWSKINKNSSDYFRGGGNMLWWMSGMSSLAAGLSAYSFTAAGAKVFETGFLLCVIYLTGVPAFFLIYFFLAHRYRQMRVVTVCDAIKQRFGQGSEQFWVWTSLFLGLFQGGMMLYIISLFVSAAIGLDITTTIIVLIVVVTIMAGTGGSWAVSASDFIQMIIILVVSFTVVIKAFSLPEIDGVAGFIDQLPSSFTNFSEHERPFIWIWLLLNFTLVSLLRSADLNTQGGKYLTVKDGDNAKKATLLMMGGTFLLPVIAFLPVMIGAILKFNLAEMFPGMSNPNEGAYLAIASHVLPQGMVGMMICAIFAATMSSMDSALNKNAGFFVKNFYCEFVRPNASEKEFLLVGKLLTLIFGVVVALVAIAISMFRGADLFSYLLKLNVLLSYPLVIPMVWGLLYRKTPPWSCWSSVIVSMTVAYGAQQIAPDTVAGLFNLEMPLNDLEKRDLGFIFSGTVTIVFGSIYFLMTSFFYKKSTKAFKDSVDGLFKNMDTPIDHEAEESEDQDSIQYKNMGLMCLVYGGVVVLGLFIPNEFSDRMIFVYNGGAILSVGALLYWIHLRKEAEVV